MARLPSVLPPSATIIARLMRSVSASSWSITPPRCSSSLRQGMTTRTDAVDLLNVAWCCMAMPLRFGAGEDMVCRWLVIPLYPPWVTGTYSSRARGGTPSPHFIWSHLSERHPLALVSQAYLRHGLVRAGQRSAILSGTERLHERAAVGLATYQV